VSLLCAFEDVPAVACVLGVAEWRPAIDGFSIYTSAPSVAGITCLIGVPTLFLQSLLLAYLLLAFLLLLASLLLMHGVVSSQKQTN